MLGGNVAERLIFGDTTTGSSNDIEKATNLARRMVTEFGMSEKLGPLAFGKREELVFLGREIGEQRNYSDDVARQIDEEVRAIIDRALRPGHGGPDDPQGPAHSWPRRSWPRRRSRPRVRGDVRGPAATERTAGIPRVIAPGTDGGSHRAAARHRPAPSRPDAARRREPSPRPLTVADRAAWSRRDRCQPSEAVARRARSTPEEDHRPTTARRHLDAYLERTQRRARTPRGAPRVRAHPQRLGAQEHAGDVRARPPSGSPSTCGASGLEHVEVSRPAATRSSTPTGSTPRAPDGHRLRPLRRPAGRPARAVGLGRPSSRRRDGPHLGRGAADDKGQVHCTSGRPRPARPARPAAAQPQLVFEGEEESGSEHFDALARRQPRSPDADLAVISDTGFFEGNLPAITIGLRGLCTRRSTSSGRRSTSTRAASAASSRTRPTRWRGSSPRSSDPDGRIRCPASTTRSRADRRRARGVRAPALRRGGVPRRDRGRPSSSASPASRPSSARRPAHAGRQRHLGRLPGRGLQDDHPGPRARQDHCRLVPDLDPATLRARARRVPDRAAGRQGRRRHCIHDGARRASRRSTTRRPRPRPGPRGGLRRRRPLPPRGRLDPGRGSVRARPRPAGRAARLHQPDEQAHAPNESLRLDNFEGGDRGSSCGIWDELAAASNG